MLMEIVVVVAAAAAAAVKRHYLSIAIAAVHLVSSLDAGYMFAQASVKNHDKMMRPLHR